MIIPTSTAYAIGNYHVNQQHNVLGGEAGHYCGEGNKWYNCITPSELLSQWSAKLEVVGSTVGYADSYYII